ncbi:glycoside hydrolase family 16 protein [Aspergillus stella-maris]|uniref:glycoside hydrolase family 16 protein n=1 Tax=Aspergillus stella-maris TaxID=1810926 RepID=UPI003CCE4D6C
MKAFTRWAAAAAAVQLCAAQTYTECNPTETTCDPDTGLSSWTFTSDFTSGDGALDGWNTTSGTVDLTSQGAAFTINEQGQSPTIESEFYIFFGRVEVVMQSANGTAIISTAILESDDLDEIDWEQISTFPTAITTNYFGKGNTTSYDRATTVSVSNPNTEFHTYTIDWTSEKTEWFIDGESVRTLNYADAVDGTNYPQTPMRVRIGIWAGGDPDNGQGTIEWAGGETDYTAAPFTMYVSSVSITNYNPADSYSWTDMTGSFDSIEAKNGTDTSGTNLGGSGSGSSGSAAGSSSTASPSSSHAGSSSSGGGASSSSPSPTPSSSGAGAGGIGGGAATSTETPTSSAGGGGGGIGGGIIPFPTTASSVFPSTFEAWVVVCLAGLVTGWLQL